jgi:hypothetical protein
MKRVIYEADGFPVSDFLVEKAVNDFLENPTEDEVSVSTENFILHTRLLIAQGKVKPESVIFEYQEEEFCVNQYGNFSKYVEGFADFASRNCENILLAQMGLYKKLRIKK